MFHWHGIILMSEAIYKCSGTGEGGEGEGGRSKEGGEGAGEEEVPVNDRIACNRKIERSR